MTTSPLQFAKDFGKLKSDLALQPAADLKLLLLLEFWLVLEQHRDNKAYRSYFDEYIPLLLHLVSEENLHDLTLPELQGVLNTLQSVNDVMSPDDRARAQDKIRLTTICLAKMLFYVGCVDEGVKLCAGLTGETSTISIEYSDLDDLSELNTLKVACDRFKDKRPLLYNIIKDILNAWESERETLSHERANCLFVEKVDHGRPTSVISKDVSSVIPAKAGIQQWRGRLRVLEGRVELFGKSAKTDEITFANQIVKPDDRFIGVAYDSLEAARQVFKTEGFKDKAGAFYHAHFSIKDSTHTFTGDSIGLAVGLVTYTQLLKPEIMRQERFLAADVAFTGGVSKDGRLTPVNKSSLACKVERAFFSPVKYLVLPESNLVAAKEHLEKLRQRFPRRRLQLIGAERLSDVIENHNVVRAEKVCMGEFVVRKVYRYSRMTKVQVPLLLGLLYLMICLLFPKASIFFDWNPQYVTVTKTGFVAMNADSTTLWSKEFKCDSIEGLQWQIGDLDGDGKSEVAIVPVTNSACSTNINLFVYNREGHLQFRKHCAILGEYPGDTTLFQSYNTHQMKFIRYKDSVIILTIVTQCFPARSHIKLWSATGDLLGWYINAGTVLSWQKVDKKGVCEELIFHGINNRMGSVCLFVLSQDSSYGVSPPYSSTGYYLSWVKRGNQLKYLIFPPTDYNRAINRQYNVSHELHFEGHSVIVVNIDEGNPEESSHVYYSLDSNLRVIDVKAGDPFIDHRNDLVDKDKLPPVDLTDYLENLRNAVTYWTDSGWVTEGELRAVEK